MFFSYLNQQSDCTTNRHTKLGNLVKKRRICYLIHCSLIYLKNKFPSFLKCSPHSIKLVSQNKNPPQNHFKMFHTHTTKYGQTLLINSPITPNPMVQLTKTHIYKKYRTNVCPKKWHPPKLLLYKTRI